VLADLQHQILLESHQLLVVQGRVNRGDQVGALSQDGDERGTVRGQLTASRLRVTV